jgi:hypothetical protein
MFNLAAINCLASAFRPLPLTGVFRMAHRSAAEYVTFPNIRESQRLYGGKEFAVLGATIGGTKDQQIVKRRTEEFAQGLCDRIERYIAKFKPDYVYLTGGGSSIAAIQRRLTKFVKNFDSVVIPIPFIDPHCTDRPAERVATAIGAASMILDAEEPGTVSEVSFERRPPSDPTFIKCRCRGGNKDCCFCWGRGYYRRSIAA